jgi:hypothetical protein
MYECNIPFRLKHLSFSFHFKARISEQIDATTARQRRCKHVSEETGMRAIMEKLLDTMFSVWAVPRLYNESRIEAEVSVRARDLKTPRALRQLKPRMTVLARASSQESEGS